VTPAAGLEIGVLGPLQVTSPEGPVDISAPKQRALLVLLALQGGRAVGTDSLTAGLWGDDPPRSAAKTLQTYVSGLRRVLPEATLKTVPGGYVLDMAPDGLDAARFERFLTTAQHAHTAGDRDRAVAALRAGLALWRGPALVDVADQVSGLAAGERLDGLRRGAAEDLAELRLSAGDHYAIVADLELAVTAEPFRERRWAQLILALYRCGRQAEALRTYRRLCGNLGDQLGIEPSAELRALEQAVLLQAAELDWTPPFPIADAARLADDNVLSATGAPAAVSSEPDHADRVGLAHNLPHQTTGFVGRRRQLDDIAALAASARLITLTGAGGVGKTRLNLQAAFGLLDGSGDGVWLVELAPVSDGSRVAAAVADALGLRGEPGRDMFERLVEFLRFKRTLIVLDNCEHVIAAAASVAARILRSCPDVCLLATSREPLGVDGEHIYRPVTTQPHRKTGV
jgi:DNA-binding SARP family transcriptional activator